MAAFRGMMLSVAVGLSVCMVQGVNAVTEGGDAGVVGGASMVATNGRPATAEEKVDLSKLSVAELNTRVDDLMEQLKQVGTDANTKRRELYHLKKKARLEDQNVKAMRREIQALRKDLEEVLNQSPAVHAKAQEIRAEEGKLKRLLKKRQEVLRAIADVGKNGAAGKKVDGVDAVGAPTGVQ